MNGYHKHVTEDMKTILRDKQGMKEPEMIKEMQSELIDPVTKLINALKKHFININILIS